MRIWLAIGLLQLVLVSSAGPAAAAPPEAGGPPWGAYCTDCRSTPWSTWSTAAAFGACVLAAARHGRRTR